MSEIQLYVNEFIQYDNIIVVGKDGEQLGEMSTKKALHLAQKQKLDLVQVTFKHDPAVCRIMDYNKFLGEKKTKSPGNKRIPKKIVSKRIA